MSSQDQDYDSPEKYLNDWSGLGHVKSTDKDTVIITINPEQVGPSIQVPQQTIQDLGRKTLMQRRIKLNWAVFNELSSLEESKGAAGTVLNSMAGKGTSTPWPVTSKGRRAQLKYERKASQNLQRAITNEDLRQIYEEVQGSGFGTRHYRRVINEARSTEPERRRAIRANRRVDVNARKISSANRDIADAAAGKNIFAMRRRRAAEYYGKQISGINRMLEI